MMKKSCLFIKKRLGFAVLVISLAMLLGCSMASVTTHKKNQETADDECVKHNSYLPSADEKNYDKNVGRNDEIKIQEKRSLIEEIETKQDFIENADIQQGRTNEIIQAKGMFESGEYEAVFGKGRWILGIDKESRILLLDEEENNISAYTQDGKQTILLENIIAERTTKINCAKWDGNNYVAWVESLKCEGEEDLGDGWGLYVASISDKIVTVVDQDAGIRAEENNAYTYAAPTNVSIADGYISYVSFGKNDEDRVTDVVKMYEISSGKLETIYQMEADPTCNVLGYTSGGNGKIAWSQAYIRPDALYEGYTSIYDIATGQIYTLDTTQNVINPCINGGHLIAENKPNNTYYDSEIVIYDITENIWKYKISSDFPAYYKSSAQGVNLGEISTWGDYVTWSGMILTNIMVFDLKTSELYVIAENLFDAGNVQIYPGGLLVWSDRRVESTGNLVGEIYYCILK